MDHEEYRAIGDRPLSEMTDEQRWQALGFEVLAGLLRDDALDDVEVRLLEHLWELYGVRQAVPSATEQGAHAFVADLMKFAESGRVRYASTGAAAWDVGTAVARRLVESGRTAPWAPFQVFAEWLFTVSGARSHGPGRTPGAGPDAGRLAEFWRVRCVETVLPVMSPAEQDALGLLVSVPEGEGHDDPLATAPPPSSSHQRPAGDETLVTVTREPTPPKPASGTAVQTPPAAPVSPRRPAAHRPDPPRHLPPPTRVTATTPASLADRVVRALPDPTTEELARLAEAIADPLAFLAQTSAFEECRSRGARAVSLVRDLEPGAEVWFAGDVHGDLLGLELVLDTFLGNRSPDARLVFLGDLVDDGPHSLRVVMRVLEVMREHPGRLSWIAGNHDVSFRYSVDTGRFVASVSPDECTTDLNRRVAGGDEATATFGRALAALTAALPRAVFLPGLLAAHGGFPHSDLWPSLRAPEDLCTPVAVGDFTWNRWSDSRYKHPNRMSTQSTFGADDFFGFCNTVRPLGLDVRAMVRGHDHVAGRAERWERKLKVPLSSYDGRILTINSLSHSLRREIHPALAVGPRIPTVARWRVGEELPSPVEIEPPPDLVRFYAPICPVCRLPGPPQRDRCVTVRNDEPCPGRYPTD